MTFVSEAFDQARRARPSWERDAYSEARSAAAHPAGMIRPSRFLKGCGGARLEW